jgi:hypothetical protein
MSSCKPPSLLDFPNEILLRIIKHSTVTNERVRIDLLSSTESNNSAGANAAKAYTSLRLTSRALHDLVRSEQAFFKYNEIMFDNTIMLPRYLTLLGSDASKNIRYLLLSLDTPSFSSGTEKDCAVIKSLPRHQIFASPSRSLSSDVNYRQHTTW